MLELVATNRITKIESVVYRAGVNAIGQMRQAAINCYMRSNGLSWNDVYGQKASVSIDDAGRVVDTIKTNTYRRFAVTVRGM